MELFMTAAAAICFNPFNSCDAKTSSSTLHTSIFSSLVDYRMKKMLGWGRRIQHRKWREIKPEPSTYLGCCLLKEWLFNFKNFRKTKSYFLAFMKFERSP